MGAGRGGGGGGGGETNKQAYKQTAVAIKLQTKGTYL